MQCSINKSYTYAHTCILLLASSVRVIIPETVSTLSEGSNDNPAKITLMLSADSYNVSVVYDIPMFRDRTSSSEALFFEEGTREAVSIKAM